MATVKSFFGSRGVVAEHVTGETNDDGRKGYLLLNDRVIRRHVISEAAARYGYTSKQIQLRLYVGRFAAPIKGDHEARVRAWAGRQRAGHGPIEVFGVDQVVGKVRAAAASKQYRDNPVLVTWKVLEAAGLLDAPLPEGDSA